MQMLLSSIFFFQFPCKSYYFAFAACMEFNMCVQQ